MVCSAKASNCAAAKTHRELFSEFYQDLMEEPLEAVLAANPRPQLSVTLFSQMMRDLQHCGGCTDPLEQVLLRDAFHGKRVSKPQAHLLSVRRCCQ